MRCIKNVDFRIKYIAAALVLLCPFEEAMQLLGEGILSSVQRGFVASVTDLLGELETILGPVTSTQ